MAGIGNSLTASEAAERAGVSTQAVSKAVRRGKLRPLSNDAWARRFAPEEIERWSALPRKPWRKKLIDAEPNSLQKRSIGAE